MRGKRAKMINRKATAELKDPRKLKKAYYKLTGHLSEQKPNFKKRLSKNQKIKLQYLEEMERRRREAIEARKPKPKTKKIK